MFERIRKTNIILYWIKELRKLKEFQEIAKVEDIEFWRLYGATDTLLANLFIETADEDGIKRFEKIVGIYPDKNDTLEQRRIRLYSWWNDRKPYTEEELRARLESLCGEGNYEINSDYKNFWIEVITHVGGYGTFEEVTYMLDYFLPANLGLTLRNLIHEQGELNIYYGVGATSAMWYQVTNDIKGSYPLSQNLFTAVPMMVAKEELFTNDVNASYSSQMDLIGGVGVTHASQFFVTNDVSAKAELVGDKTVGQAVSTSRVITIN